jgi:peptide/nickel transport system permease protein
LVLFIARRFVLALLVLWAAVTITFFVLYLTGDPLAAILRQAGSDPASLKAARHAYGFDRPLSIQYLSFLGRLLRGDFGTSIQSAQPCLTMIVERIPATLRLTGAAVLLTTAVSIPLGLLSAVKQNSVVDRTAGVSVGLFQSVPSFVIGPLLIYFLAVRARVFPVAGSEGFSSIILPAVTLALYPTAVVTRVLRASALEVLPLDFVTIARAKGLGEGLLLIRHVLRNALLPVLTVTGLLVAELLGGAVIVENIFAWPGLGQLSVQALLNSDFPLIRAVIIVVACAVITINLLVDLLYGVIDPRARVM